MEISPGAKSSKRTISLYAGTTAAFGPTETPLEKLSEVDFKPEHSNAEVLDAPKIFEVPSSITNNPMDDWLGSLMGESVTPSSNEPVSPPLPSIPQPEPNTSASAPENEPVSFLDNLLESVFEEPSTAPISEQLPSITEETKEETVSEPVQPYLVADHQTVFIDENTPENSLSFETQLDTIAFALNDEINEELLGHQQFSFKHDDALAPHDLIITKSEQFEKNDVTQKIPSITLDAGIIISDEPLPISEMQDEPTVKLADLILNDKNEDGDTAIILPDIPITLGLTGQQNQVSTSVGSDNTIAFAMISDANIKDMVTDNTGCTHFYANGIIAGDDNSFTRPIPAKKEIAIEHNPLKINKPQEAVVKPISDNVSYAPVPDIPEKTEIILEPVVPLVSFVEPEKIPATKTSFDMASVQTNIRFIPVKNTRQDWVFSVIDFNSLNSVQHTSYSKPMSDFHFETQPALQQTQPTAASSPPQANEIKIQLDTTYDDLDFDFSSLFETEEPKSKPASSPALSSMPSVAVRSKSTASNPAFANYPVGSLVDHPHYGRGVVQKITQAPHQNTILHIEFEKHGKRLLDPSLTQLKRLNTASR